MKLETGLCRDLYQFSGAGIKTNTSLVLVVVKSKVLLTIVKNKRKAR